MFNLGSLESASLPKDAIEVATVVDAWGVKGWIKLRTHSPDPQALFSSKRWYLIPKTTARDAEEKVLRVAVRDARHHANWVVAQIEGVDDRASAEAWRGARILVPRSSFPTPADDEYYWVDLLGLEVVNREGIALGRVVVLHPTGPHAVLVLDYAKSGGSAAQRMIPFVSAFVDTVSLPERRIVVDWPPDE